MISLLCFSRSKDSSNEQIIFQKVWSFSLTRLLSIQCFLQSLAIDVCRWITFVASYWPALAPSSPDSGNTHKVGKLYCVFGIFYKAWLKNIFGFSPVFSSFPLFYLKWIVLFLWVHFEINLKPIFLIQFFFQNIYFYFIIYRPIDGHAINNIQTR